MTNDHQEVYPGVRLLTDAEVEHVSGAGRFSRWVKKQGKRLQNTSKRVARWSGAGALIGGVIGAAVGIVGGPAGMIAGATAGAKYGAMAGAASGTVRSVF